MGTWSSGWGSTTTRWLPSARLATSPGAPTCSTSRCRGSCGIGESAPECSSTLAADLEASDRRGIVLEIEDPARTEDPLTAERRKGFYARWGAEPLAGLAGYYIPDRVEPDTAVPMLLLWRPSSLGASQPAGDELRSLVRQLYEFEYAEFAPADYLPRVLAGVAT